MIPIRQLGKHLIQGGRTPVVRSAVFGAYRLNSTIATNVSTTASESKKPANQQSPKSSNKPSRPYLNPKVWEIKKQIDRTIQADNISESKEIFEEGISYIRSIQQTEKISDRDIYNNFQPLATKLLQIMIDNGEPYESLKEALEMFITYKVVNTFNFFQLMNLNITNQNYEANFELWIKDLECMQVPELSQLMLYKYKHIEELNKNFKPNVLSDIVYYSYFKVAEAGKIKFNNKDLMSLLNTKELIPIHFVIRTLVSNGIKDVRGFRKFVNGNALNTMTEDPNSTTLWRHLDELTTAKDMNGISAMYDKLTKSDTQLSLKTIHKFMSSFYELENFDMVFQIFSKIVVQDSKLHPQIWDLVIKSIGHSEKAKKLSAEDKAQLSEHLDVLIASMIKQGIDIDAKILSSIIASYANLNSLEKVNEYFETYQGKVPIIHSTLNNYLNGLILNNEIKLAESSFIKYTKDASYKPSVMVVNNFLNYYAKEQNLNAVRGIIDYMNKHKIAENIATLTILTELFFKINSQRGQPSNIEQILSLFVNSNVKINVNTISVIINGLVANRNIDAARILYKNLANSNQFKNRPSADVLTTMIKGEIQLGSIKNAQEMFDDYIKTVSNDVRVWNMMIASLLDKRESLAIDYYEKLKRQNINNVHPNLYTFYFMLKHYRRTNNIDMLNAILADLGNANLSNIGEQIPKILKALKKGNEVKIPDSLQKYL